MCEITVLLPLYRERIEVINEAIMSVLNQTYADTQVLIALDDPKNDEIINYIGKLSKEEPRIEFFVNKENKGLAGTLNAMIERVKTTYIARMDADDISELNRLEIQYAYMKSNPEVDLCGTNIIYIDKEGKIIRENESIPTESEDIAKALKFKNCMSHPTFFSKTEVMKTVKYRDSIKYAQDYDFICRSIEMGYKITNIDQYLLKYRIDQISKSKMLRQNMTAFYVKKFYRKNQLCQHDDIAEIIENDIVLHGEAEMIKAASFRETLENIKSSVRINDIFINLKLLVPHKYKVDTWTSLVMYKLYGYDGIMKLKSMCKHRHK